MWIEKVEMQKERRANKVVKLRENSTLFIFIPMCHPHGGSVLRHGSHATPVTHLQVAFRPFMYQVGCNFAWREDRVALANIFIDWDG